MAGKVLPGSRYAAGGNNNNSNTGGRQFSVQESAVMPGSEVSDPYDSPAEGSVAVRDALAIGAETAAGFGKEQGGSDSAGTARPEPQAPAAPERGRMPSWEEEQAMHPEDLQEAYRLHMKGMAQQFRSELLWQAEIELGILAAQSEAAVGIERDRKNTIDYAMAAYGEDADLRGISERAMAAQQVNAKEMTGPFTGVSFRVNQALSGGKDSLVRLPNGAQVEMSSPVASLLSMPEEAKGIGMANMFVGYVRETDPGFLSAIESAGGTSELARNDELQFDRGEEEKLKRLWDKVVEAQKDTMDYEHKPTDKLSPKEYQALGLDPAEARERRLREHGDPSEALGVSYSPMEYTVGGQTRRLPDQVGYQQGYQKDLDEPQR